MSAAHGSGEDPHDGGAPYDTGPPHGPHDQPHTRTREYLDAGDGAEPRRPRPLRALVTVVGLAALLVVALVLVNRGHGTPASGGGARAGDGAGASQDARSGTPSPESTRASGRKPVPGTDPATGIPVGYGRSAQGAESAATNYAVALGSSDMYTDDKRHAIVAAVAASGSKDALTAETDKGLTYSRRQFGLASDGSAPKGLTFVCRTVPVGSKIASYDSAAGTASVEIWSSGLIGLAGTGSTRPVTESWFTTTVKLTWQDHDWKLVSSTQKDGPAPISGDSRAATAQEIEKAVREFGGYTYAR